MLNFIYYPVSAILWFWHKVFGFALGADNGFAWALSVIFLVFTLRALLFKPFVSQVRSMRKMQEFQPQIKKLQEKYKNDKQKLAEEMQKLQKEHGVNPLGGCLPVLVQLPVFIGLFHVLRGFQPNYPYNYVFDRADVVSFNNASILGVKLSQAIFGGAQELGHFSLDFSSFNPSVVPVALPLMIIASVATHFTARISAQHQSPASAANPQAAIMQKLTMWLFPLGVLVFGAFFPIAILLYWLSNNSWTLTQQWYVYGRIAREEETRRAQAAEQRDHLAPKPGQKPKRPEELRAGETEPVAEEPQDAPAPANGTTPGNGATGQNGAAPGTKPKPGARPTSGKSSGRAAPGKVGSPTAKSGSGGKNGARSGQQLASSGRPGGGKKSKKRR
ncbi:membrane protein insertase YidC [Actinomycetospora sp. TBRC 11914]|uniref:membrane protein insertase YidC n=1 Tax=Actinomycetospora sp. TBRC 11914 TaxID=2729387 RepID=UPI00145FC8C1|nr:membrane protein insertase YidC [Actinomycetospora sp. TBRC 11914]NMO90265.1 membrane protein insertase YidC [Actinomycetospora sp. TBRC 11914]